MVSSPPGSVAQQGLWRAGPSGCSVDLTAKCAPQPCRVGPAVTARSRFYRRQLPQQPPHDTGPQHQKTLVRHQPGSPGECAGASAERWSEIETKCKALAIVRRCSIKAVDSFLLAPERAEPGQQG